MLNIPAIDASLRQTIFHGKLHGFKQIDSTNSKALAEALTGAEEGATYLAEEQTAGRGRGGHSWHSEPGAGIYLSTILRPRLQPNDILWLSLLTGLAVQAAVKEIASVVPDLRWPNDLMLSGKKFCGILAEMNSTRPVSQSTDEAARFIVVGIGINVNHASFPADLSAIATSLRVETGSEWPREDLTAALLQALHREYRALTTEAASATAGASILRRFEAASSYACGKQVHVEEGGGYTGVTAGLDERGFLRVRTETGLRTVLSGGVREIIPA